MSTQTQFGNWFEYGYDGRATTNEADAGQGRSVRNAGQGWRARILPNVHGGDYGWGPQAQTEAEAIVLAIAEMTEATAE